MDPRSTRDKDRADGRFALRIEMKHFFIIITLGLLCGVSSKAQVPDTPAGRQLLAWQKAQDSGDKATIQDFIAHNMPWENLDQAFVIGKQSGGFQIKSVISSTDTQLIVLAKEKGIFQLDVRITISVESLAPYRITGMLIRPLEAAPNNTNRRAPSYDTAAGRQLLAWQKAQDSGDKAIIQDFITKECLGGSVEQELNQHNQSGGYDFKKIESSRETEIVVLARERAALKQYSLITLRVTPDESSKITLIMVQPAPPPAEEAQPDMTEAEIAVARKGVPFKKFSEWLEAFNTGDKATIASFLSSTFPSENLEEEMDFRQRSGGFELRKLEQATATTLTGLVQERGSDQFARFGIAVEPSGSSRILELPIRAIRRPLEFPMEAMTDAQIVTGLRTTIERESAADRFSGAIIFSKKNEILFSGAYGFADRERRILNNLDTRFRIGSMNKMFTAVSILQLVELGKIKLDAPFGNYISDYPNREVASKVTIHHLLTHTGGMGDIFGPEFSEHISSLRTLDDYVALYGKRGLAFEPGTDWEYSNYGMLILGVVIQRVSGQSYYDFVSEHIYKPVRMDYSGSEPEEDVRSSLSVGYLRNQQGGWTANTATLPYRGTSAGGGYTTVGDLLKFADALMEHRLLSPESTDLLLTGKAGPSGSRIYAYGFQDDRIGGFGSVGHGGGAPGMNGDLKIYPKSGHVVVVLSNLSPPAAQKISEFVDLRVTAQERSSK